MCGVEAVKLAGQVGECICRPFCELNLGIPSCPKKGSVPFKRKLQIISFELGVELFASNSICTRGYLFKSTQSLWAFLKEKNTFKGLHMSKYKPYLLSCRPIKVLLFFLRIFFFVRSIWYPAFCRHVSRKQLTPWKHKIKQFNKITKIFFKQLQF